MQRESLANLDEQLTDPQSLALVRMRRTINPYSKDDVRYIATPQEEIEEVSGPESRRLSEALRRLSRRAGRRTTLVGDFDPDEIRPLLEKIFDGWKAKQPYSGSSRSSSTKCLADGNKSSRRTRPMPFMLPERSLP